MTTLTGPFKVKALDSQATAVRMDVDGSAKFTGSLEVDEGATFGEKITIGTGLIEVIQQVTILANNTVASPVTLTLPSASNITDVIVDIEEPFVDAEASVNTIEIDINVNGVLIGNVTANTSGRFRPIDGAPAVDRASLRNISGLVTVTAFTSMSDEASAFAAGQGILTVRYVVN